jgi:DNA end-binding protein Ku
MARSIWTGVISFGLVSVPAALYSATEEHEVSFHQFERDTSDRIRYKRVNERTDKELITATSSGAPRSVTATT